MVILTPFFKFWGGGEDLRFLIKYLAQLQEYHHSTGKENKATLLICQFGKLPLFH